MPLSSADLWKLLKQSRLLAPERLEQVREALAQAGQDPDQVPAQSLAQWLLQRQLLTAYQANILLNGRAGPFFYGDYQVQQRVRGGRFARAFHAVHMPTRYRVLLKFAESRFAQDPRQWNTARQYLRGVAPLVHDQLQRVFSLEDESGYRYLVLERLSGSTVADRLKQDGKLPVAQACQVAHLVAQGLDALHQHDQVYGDLRPQNVWLDASGNVLLLRDQFLPPVVPAPWLPSTSDTQLEQADYLAPELANPGMSLSRATDLYALGCLLYQLLQGEVSFPGGDIANKLQRHATEPLRPITAQPITPPVQEMLEQLLAKDVAQRTADAGKVAQQLLECIETGDRRAVNVAPSATLLAFEKAMGQAPAYHAPAPPPIMSEPDDHPPLPQPPVQAVAATTPVHQTQEIETQEERPPTTDETGQRKEIDVVAEPRHPSARQRARRRRDARRKQALVLSALAVLLLIAAGVVVTQIPGLRNRIWRSSETDQAKLAQQDQGFDKSPTKADKPGKQVAASTSDRDRANRFVVRNDDGQSLWMAPTVGAPVTIQYVAAGAQLLMVARPHAIASAEGGAAVLQALGPHFVAVRTGWETQAGIQLDDVEQLVLSVHPAAAGAE